MRFPTLCSVALFVAAPLSAQAFQGTIAMRASDPQSGAVMDMTVYTDGTKQAMVMTAVGGPAAGREMRAVINPATRKMTMLIAMPGMPGGAKGMKMVTDFGSNDTDASAAAPTIKQLGTKQTIAGMSCDDYEITADGNTFFMCGTAALGRYTLPDMNQGGRNANRPAWANAFGDRPFFPLKVWTKENSVSMEVTSVKRGAVAAEVFDENPAGYMTAPAMPGARRN